MERLSDSIKKAVNAKQDNNYDALTDIANSLNTPKDLNTVFKKAKVSKPEAAFLLPYSSVWTSKLNKIAHPIENSTENLTNYEVATKGLKDSEGGLVAIGTVLKTALMNPMTWIAGAGIAAIGRMVYKATEFDRAINATSKSQSVFASASNELSTLNSQLDATASRISELKALKAQGNLSPSESSELEALNLQNSELELQIQLKKRSAAQLSDAAVKNAISALRQKNTTNFVADDNTGFIISP